MRSKESHVSIASVQAVRGPGLIFILPFVRQIVRADLRTVVMAERDRRAKVIHAEAEFQAAQTLLNVAQIFSIG
jgi:regulator of protease activity HflC (stomatin/prohibitin superfamily)